MATLTSWVQYSPETDFPIQNLPFGVFSRKNTSESARVGVAIGDYVLDLSVISDAGLLPTSVQKVFHQVSNFYI